MRADSPVGLKRIFEGRLARRRMVLENREPPSIGKLIDHEAQV